MPTSAKAPLHQESKYSAPHILLKIVFFQEKLKNVSLTEDQEHYQRDFFAMLEVLFDEKIPLEKTSKMRNWV